MSRLGRAEDRAIEQLARKAHRSQDWYTVALCAIARGHESILKQAWLTINPTALPHLRAAKKLHSQESALERCRAMLSDEAK